MRVVVCPDSFTGTLDAAEAARAMREGWLQQCPNDEVALLPLSDGGPGFVVAIAEATGAQLRTVVVHDPLGRDVPAAYAIRGYRAWIESAAACGLHLLAEHECDPQVTSTFGVEGNQNTSPNQDYLTGYIELGWEGAGNPAPVARAP